MQVLWYFHSKSVILLCTENICTPYRCMGPFSWIYELLMVLPLFIVNINELQWIKKPKTIENTFLNSDRTAISLTFFFFPTPTLLLLNNGIKCLLPFSCAIAHLCHNSEEIIVNLIYEFKRTSPKELQFEIFNSYS